MTFTLTRAQVRDLDRRAVEEYGIPGVVLMENAGRGCAELLMRLNPAKKPTVILCGPGNNGGDGFVMARHLDNHGWPVEVWDHSGDGGSEELGVNRRVAKACGLVASSDPPPGSSFTRTDLPLKGGGVRNTSPLEGEVGDAGGVGGRGVFRAGGWVIDALFGTGLSRPLATPYSELVAQVNASNNPVLAIDIPSGLDCDTGEPHGPTVRATHTATFVAPKRGFLNPKAKEWTGEVHVIDIGAPKMLVEEYRN